jgi:tRNA(Arg) A34 adenosine deaminase TadA
MTGRRKAPRFLFSIIIDILSDMKNIQYPYLPEGREIKYAPFTNDYMRAAYEYSKAHSSDRNHPTGAVVVKDGSIIGSGANQVPIKNEFMKKVHKELICIRKIFKVKSGEKYWLCPGCAKCDDHGEQQSVRDAIKNVGNIEGADLYLWGHWWCCKPCWDAMIAAGIKEVYLLEESEVLFDRNNPGNKLGLFEV